MPEVGLSLGSNLGDKAGTIETALRRLDSAPDIRLVKRSRLYRTAPWGKTDQDWFINACAIVRTELSARVLLERCLQIETELGRDRSVSVPWGPRPIDIDLLFYGNQTISEPGLEIPHPHMLERAFVLVPLAEIAEERIVAGRRIRDLVRMTDASGVSVLDGICER